MLTALGLAYGLLTLGLAPLFGFLGLITAAALVRRRGGLPVARTSRRVRFAFVIPAYDEESNVGATVASCKAVDYDPADLAVYVVADNCSDDTASVARVSGAEVFERCDSEHRSKGHALEYGFQKMAASGDFGRFDAVIIVDADTLVDPGLPAAFAATLAGGADWAQCYYTVSNPDASWRTRLLTYAFSLFNGVWLLGQDGLGLSVGLRGNGMCFSTTGLARFPWKAHGLVEDQEFAWQLRLAGERVRFVPGGRVYAEMVSRGADAVSQRRRWEEGRRALREKFRGPLLSSRTLNTWHKLLALLDLQFPPLVPLFAAFLLAATIHPLVLLDPNLAPLSRSLRPWHALMALAAAGYAISPFLTLSLPFRYLWSLTALPYYAFWKIAASSHSKTTSWVRTRRETVAPRNNEGAGQRRATPGP